MENLAKAVIQVMTEVKNIDKGLSVGAGRNTYKGVADKDVKQIIGKAMQKAGLCMLPLEVDPKVTIERWTETYNGQAKQKQSVFTEVKTKYLLLHESGESQIIEGYGQGIDSQDKGAGKATTYALKYALLYSFLTPTGHIDDTDAHASDDIEAPFKPTETKPTPKPVAKKATQKQNKAKVSLVEAVEKIEAALDLDMLKAAWSEIGKVNQTNEVIISKKDAMKQKLS